MITSSLTHHQLILHYKCVLVRRIQCFRLTETPIMSSILVRHISRSLLRKNIKNSLIKSVAPSEKAPSGFKKCVSFQTFLSGEVNLRDFSSNCVHLASSNPSGNVIGDLTPRLAISYKCKICGTRNTQSFSKKSYTEGVVIVQCENCKSHHLIADNLGWFEDIKEK